MLAQVNPTPGKCWGCLTRQLGYCLYKQRPGKLTCVHHRNAENAAQTLRKKKEAGGILGFSNLVPASEGGLPDSVRQPLTPTERLSLADKLDKLLSTRSRRT